MTSYSAGQNLYNTDLAALLPDLGTVPRTGDQVINTPKIDWQINQKQHLSFLFHRLRWDSPGGVQTQATNNYAIDSFGTDFVKLDYGLARLETLISNNLSNEVRYQYSRELNDEGSQTQSAYTKSHFIASTGIPIQLSLQSSNGFTAGIPYYSFRAAYPDERKWQASDTATWTYKQHSVKVGFDIVHNYDLQNNLFESNGVYSYTYLQNYFADLAKPSGSCIASSPSATGIGTYPCYASLAQGFGGTVFDLQTIDYGFFVQDDWKVSSRLTLNLGLRYDYESLPSQFANLTNPAYPATGTKPSDTNNYGPRIGFAYDPYGAGKTVIRGGYGMYFGRVFNSLIFNTYLNSGLPAGQNVISYKNNASNAPKFPNTIAAGPVGTLPGTPNIEYFAPNFQNPMVHEFDMTVQQQVGSGTTISVTYLGALGRELPNFLNLNLGNTYATTTTVTAAAGTTGCGPLACGTQFTNQVFTGGALNPAFGAITQVTSNVNSSYNGLVGEVKNNSSKYVQFDMNYTWSHALDFNQNQSTAPTTNSWFNPYASGRSNYGDSNFNVPNRLVGYALIFLPSTARGWKSYVLNGWDINPLMQMQNGLPYSYNTTGFVTGNSFAGGVNGSGVTYIPQLGRNTFQQKRTIVFDTRLEKEIKVHEGYTLQLIGEGFNLANHQNVTGVNTTGYTIGGTAAASTLTYNTSAGTVTNANSNYVYSPRQIQLAVRLEF